MLQHDCQSHTRLVSINKKYAFYSCFCPDIRASFPWVLQASIQCVFNSEMIRYHTEMAILLSHALHFHWIRINFSLFFSNRDFSSLIGRKKVLGEKCTSFRMQKLSPFPTSFTNNTHSLWNEIWWKNKMLNKNAQVGHKCTKYCPLNYV